MCSYFYNISVFTAIEDFQQSECKDRLVLRSGVCQRTISISFKCQVLFLFERKNNSAGRQHVQDIRICRCAECVWCSVEVQIYHNAHSYVRRRFKKRVLRYELCVELVVYPFSNDNTIALIAVEQTPTHVKSTCLRKCFLLYSVCFQPFTVTLVMCGCAPLYQ